MSTYSYTHKNGTVSTKNSKTKAFPYAIEVEVNPGSNYYSRDFFIAGWCSTADAATKRLTLVNKLVGPDNRYRIARIVETNAD